MTHPVFYFHSLINSGRLRDVPTCTRVKATQQVRELGLLTTTPPLLHRLLYSRELASCLLIQQNSSQLWRCRWGCKAYSSDDPGAGGSSVGITYPRPRSSLQPGLLTLDKSQRARTQALPAVPCSPKTCPFWGVTLSWRKGLELIQKDKVNQTSYFSSPAHPLSSLRQLAASQQQDAAFQTSMVMSGFTNGSKPDRNNPFLAAQRRPFPTVWGCM